MPVSEANLWSRRIPGRALPLLALSIVLIIALTHSAVASSSGLLSTTAQSVGIDTVVRVQPNVEPDVETSSSFVELRYCTSSTADYEYITYVYTWGTSDSPWFGELLGYGGHSWDFEPITARINIGSGKVDYAYDSGHYKAGFSSGNMFRVDSASHRFFSMDARNEESSAFNDFVLITDESLQDMNQLLATIPRLPLGPPLSLDWACSSPSDVFEEGFYSSDEGSMSVLPIQTVLLLSALLGLLVAPIYYYASKTVGNLTKHRLHISSTSALSGTIIGIAVSVAMTLASDTVSMALYFSLSTIIVLYFGRVFASTGYARESRHYHTLASIYRTLIRLDVLLIATTISTTLFLVF